MNQEILGDKENFKILTIKENSAVEPPTWEFYGDPFSCRKQKSKPYMIEDVDSRGILVVFLNNEEGKIEVWRYNMKGYWGGNK